MRSSGAIGATGAQGMTPGVLWSTGRRRKAPSRPFVGSTSVPASLRAERTAASLARSGERIGQLERAGEQRAADHHAVASGLGDAADIVGGADAAGCQQDVPVVASRTAASSFRSGPASVPSRSIAVTRNAPTPCPSRRRTSSTVGSPESSSHPATRAEPSSESAVRQIRSPCLATISANAAGSRSAKRAHEDAVDTRRERILDGLGGAKPPAHLQLAALARDEPVEQRAVGLAADTAARRVEIDHVEPARPCCCEPVGERLRVASEVGRRLEAALDEPHDAAVDEIDGGDDVHGGVTVPSIVLA